MKSFGIKRDEKDPRWAKFIEWANERHDLEWKGGDVLNIYGLKKNGLWSSCRNPEEFERIITLDEWESEFMPPKLAGRGYDEKLLNDFRDHFCDLKTVDQYKDGTVKRYFMFEESYIKDMVDIRYAKTDRISELKSQIEKLTNELKELES